MIKCVKILLSGVIFLFPSSISRLFVNCFTGFFIGKGVRIGFTLMLCDRIKIADGCYIGHFNLISSRNFEMKENNKIKHFNRIHGRFDMIMYKCAWINSQNRITGLHHISYSVPQFIMGEPSVIIMNHAFDVTDSITLKKGVLFAGSGSQVWTHAFYMGKNRNVRIDGAVEIGERCYIGARSVICSGVKLADAIVIGANTTVSKSLTQSGLYVNQALRYIPFDADESIQKLEELNCRVDKNVYRKNI